MNKLIRVLLVDDHVMVRTGLRVVLEASGHVQVVGEATTADAALVALTGAECDVAVIDVTLPIRDGLWLTRAIRQRFHQVGVLLLCEKLDKNAINRAQLCGTNGYIPKVATCEQLLEAIAAVHHSGLYHWTRATREPDDSSLFDDEQAPGGLSGREREILYRAAAGLTNLQIGRELGLSESTVKKTLGGLYRRFQVDDRTQAVMHALQQGLIQHWRGQAPGRGFDATRARGRRGPVVIDSGRTLPAPPGPLSN